MIRHNRGLVSVSATLVATAALFGGAMSLAHGQSTIAAPATNLSAPSGVVDSYQVGSRLAVNDLIERSSLDDWMLRTTGDVKEAAVRRWGNFEAYFQASQTSREGKALEAIATHIHNSRNQALGQGNRWVTTASLGQPFHPADILEVDADGRVIRQIQAGKGHKNVLGKISDVKYKDMAILTDADTYRSLELELASEMNKAKITGKALPPKMAELKKAMESGRLLSQLPCGAPLPSSAYITKVTRAFLAPLFADKAARLAGTSIPVRNAARKVVSKPSLGKLARAADNAGGAPPSLPTPGRGMGSVGKVAGAAGAVVDVGVRGYEAKRVEDQYRRGEISSRERKKRHARNAGGMVGGWAGAWAGFKVGVIGGGAAGTCAVPGAGTAVGGAVGGIVGGIAGFWGGEAAGGAIAESAVD